MNIRTAQITDTEQLTYLGKQLLDIHYDFDPDYYAMENNFREQFTLWIREQIGNAYTFLLVAENEKSDTDGLPKIAGFISGFIKPLYHWFKIKSVGHISYLIVHPKYRRSGIAKKLEEAAVDWFHDKQVRYIELYVEEKNFTGLTVWNNLGYKPFKKFLRKKI